MVTITELLVCMQLERKPPGTTHWRVTFEAYPVPVYPRRIIICRRRPLHSPEPGRGDVPSLRSPHAAQPRRATPRHAPPLREIQSLPLRQQPHLTEPWRGKGEVGRAHDSPALLTHYYVFLLTNVSDSAAAAPAPTPPPPSTHTEPPRQPKAIASHRCRGRP